MIKTHFFIKTLKSKHGNVGVINEIGATQELWLDLALGHHGMSPLRVDVASRRHVVRDCMLYKSHKIMV